MVLLFIRYRKAYTLFANNYLACLESILISVPILPKNRRICGACRQQYLWHNSPTLLLHMCDEHVVAVMIAQDTYENAIVKVYKRVDFEVVQFYLLQSSFIKIIRACDVIIGLLSNAVAIRLIVWLYPYSYWNSNWVSCSLDINVSIYVRGISILGLVPKIHDI